MSVKPKRTVPVLALDVAEAAESISVGDDWFREHVAPEIPWIRRGRKKIVAVAELERWLAENSERLPVSELVGGQ